jgi:putative ABC transport system permease protein
MDSVQLLIVFVTNAGVFDLLLSAILERRREIALWRLIGAPAATVRRAILVESATLGSGACALGAVVGCVTAWLWIRFNFRHLLGYHLEFHLDVARVVWFMVLAWLTTTLAGHFAAAWAVRHPIIQGMRSD